MPKRIYVLNGHPAQRSLSHDLAEQYAHAARDAEHEVKTTHLHEIEFDSDFGFGGYTQTKALETPVDQFLENLAWADHVVIAAPMWWGGLPAKLKGLIDRAFLPGRTFDTRNKTWAGFPKPMLSGRSARVIITSDTPGWLMRFCYGNALFRQIRHQVLGFVGIAPARITHFRMASHPNPNDVDGWMRKVEALGQAAA